MNWVFRRSPSVIPANTPRMIVLCRNTFFLAMLHSMVDSPITTSVSRVQTTRDLRPRTALTYLWAMTSVAIATAVSWTLHGLIADESLSMVFLTAVLVSSVAHGRNIGIVAALAAFLSYNFLILEPRFGFRFTPLSDTITLAVFLAVALLTGGLAGRVRDQALAMTGRASTMTMLFKASQALAKSADQSELVSILANQVAVAIGTPSYIFLRCGDGIALAATGSAIGNAGDSRSRQPEKEIVVFAERVWTQIGTIGDGAPRMSSAGNLSVLPLGSMRQPMGLLICERPTTYASREIDDHTFAVFCELGAIALERAYLMQEMTKTQVLAQSDRLRTALLSSISHDFRTPLSGILASATALIEHGHSFDVPTTNELLTEIRDQAERINRYVANLLDMIKLESGTITVKLEPTDPIDIIAAASRRCGGAGAKEEQRWLRRAFPSQTCLLEADPVLLEQAIFNVIENATLYSPPGSLVEISLHASLHLVEIVIADEGPGISPQDLDRVFDKFYRVSGDVTVQGTGLGLPICRGLVEAMGGTVSAISPIKDGLGTAVHICLRRVTEA